VDESIVLSPAQPDGNTYTNRIVTPAGISSDQGLQIAGMSYSFTDEQEMWRQFYIYYPSNYTFHPIAEKICGWHFHTNTNENTQLVWEYGTFSWGPGNEWWPETNYPTYPGNVPAQQTGVWYTFREHVKMNTVGQNNGVYEMWVAVGNGPLAKVYNITNVGYKYIGDDPSWGFGGLREYLVWGGQGGGITLTEDMYSYYGTSIVGNENFSYGGGGDITPPSLGSQSPSSGQTGWPVASQNVTFYVDDSSGVDSSTLNFNINGGTNRTCASGLSCTPSGDPTSLYVVYDRGSPWEYDTTYTVNVSSVYDIASPPNQQSTSWQFTTEAAPPDATDPTLESSTPSSGQTGWELNSWQVVFDVSDAGNVDETTLQFNIDGGATQTCGSGLTCSWVIPTTLLRATYSRGSDWLCETTYTANIPQVKDTTGNTLTTSWTFSTVACPEAGPGGDIIIHIHED